MIGCKMHINDFIKNFAGYVVDGITIRRSNMRRVIASDDDDDDFVGDDDDDAEDESDEFVADDDTDDGAQLKRARGEEDDDDGTKSDGDVAVELSEASPSMRAVKRSRARTIDSNDEDEQGDCGLFVSPAAVPMTTTPTATTAATAIASSITSATTTATTARETTTAATTTSAVTVADELAAAAPVTVARDAWGSLVVRQRDACIRNDGVVG